MNPHPNPRALGWVALFAAGGLASAGTIVPDLSDGTALYSQTSANTGTIGATDLASGLTLAAQFTPSTTDLSNSTTGAVGIIEIGGTTSGSGLWLIDGSVWFLSSSGDANAFPSGPADLAGGDAAFGIQLGMVAANVETTIFVSLDTTNATILVGQDGAYSEFSLTGVTGTWNWRGNSTVSFGTVDETVPNAAAGLKGYRGGLTDNATAGDFFTNNAVALDGTVTLGQVFNAVSTVPEPTTGLLALGGLAGMAFFRRR
ncbi:hypothetical protein HNR46_004226 [Haloferula luteola]|uniref:Ice-binding protein C-terminal domain-containing protein n=1 Tax=Haloferula luteola TaxID=595692 RepID=A0A840VA48_9BACT|nr:PEP-CTERM sorting domain-containing protein [Haloferula luteola]MBB5353956.1 hypothetical protein [Haloferula luteola]